VTIFGSFVGISQRLTFPSSPAGLAQDADGVLERDEPLGVLAGCLAQARRGSGTTAFVAGEAGIGKSTLLRAFAARHPDVRLWWGACDALQTPNPLAPLYDIARSGDVRFDALLRVDGGRAALFDSVVADLQQGERPTVMVIEDAHWADEATLDLLKFLGRRVDRLPCLLAVSYRDDEVTVTHPLRRVIGGLAVTGVTRIDVPRLSPGAVEQLAHRALQSPAGIYEATGGNAFFVTEILRNATGGMPRSIEDLVLGRFAKLSPGAQAIVKLASIVPGKIERRLLERLASSDVATLEECLDSALVEADGATLRFRHELARSVIEGALSEPAARALHARLLEAFSQDGEDGPPLSRLVHHAIRAGDEAAVLRFAPAAAREAAERGSHREAAAHYRHALAHARPSEDRAGLLEAYASECTFTLEYKNVVGARVEADALYRSAGNELREAENLGELALAYARALHDQGADAASLRAIDLLEARAPGAELARAYRVRASICFMRGDLADAIVWSRKALPLAEHVGAADVLAAARGTLGAALLASDYDAGREHMRRALDLAVANGFEFLAAVLHNNLGSGSVEVFRLREARAYLLEAKAFAQKRENESAAKYASSHLALCEMYLGRWDEGVRAALEIVDCTANGRLFFVAALLAIARIRTRRGEPGAAGLLDEALAIAEQSGRPGEAARVRAARAEAAYGKGDLQATLAEVRPALDAAAACGDPWLGGELAYWLHRAGAREVPDVPCAEPFALQIAGRFREAAELWGDIGCPYERARALAEGDAAAQVEALAIFEGLGAEPDLRALRRRLRAAAVRGVPRGPRAATKAHPRDLTERELEVLALLCRGLKNAEIAEHLCRSVRTVDNHVAAAFVKLGVSTRTQAAATAIRLGIAAEHDAQPAAQRR
jgi:DNA-binding CsgD family transcriptional regulator